VIITENAKSEILKRAKFLKILVELGGCAGFQYNLEYTNDTSDYKIVEDIILTDEASLELISEIELDFVQQLEYNEFIIKNPKAKSGCGCGNSFG
jgi:iron-sulfur cluster insertion protein